MDDKERTTKTPQQTLRQPSEAMMEFIRRNEDVLFVAADAALLVEPESTEQRAVLMFDMSEERSRNIAQIGVDVGMVPPIVVSEQTDAMVLVVTLEAARSLVEVASGLPIDRFDSAAIYSSAMRGTLLVVLSCGTTFVGCLPRAGAETAKA